MRTGVTVQLNPTDRKRKNWLFAGSDAGGETLANAMTIIETAKHAGLGSVQYLSHI